MSDNNALVIDRLVKAGVVGGFCGMAATGWTLWFDVSSIGTLLASSQNTLLANLFLGGGMLKGALLGGAIGLVMLGGTPRPKKATLNALPVAQSFTR
jgi:hypothetical protein